MPQSATGARPDEVAPADTYPLPERDADTRFTFGLALDVAAVLERHGYPAPTSGADWVELQQSLFRYLYVPRGAVGGGAS